MEIKKTPKANLESKKFLFREIGLVFTLLFVLLAFEWKSSDKSVSSLANTNAAIMEDFML